MRKILFFAFLSLTVFALAQEFPAKPVNYVTDEAGILTDDEENNLNTKLRNFEDTTSNQIFVYVASTLNGADMTSLCQEIFTKWEIGAKGKDNGVLVGVFVDDRQFRIQTGYGLEGALPDILTKKIQDEDMKPEFKNGNYYAGIDAGIDKLMFFSGHEFSQDKMDDEYGNDNWIGWLLGFGPNLLLATIIIYNLYGNDYNKKKSKLKKGIILGSTILLAAIPCLGAFILFFMLAAVIDFSSYKGSGGGSGGSSWRSSSSSGSSWRSSSSGSSFSGGGGGRSGGGGSSSSW